MLASIFIVQGLDTVLHPDRKVAAAEPVVRPLAERVPFIPDDVETSVRLSGAVQVVAGSLLAIGRFPRLSALAIAVDLVPTTYAGHRFWETDDKQERMQQRIHFLKNLSILGGLLIAAGDTAGNPSLAWRQPARGRLRQARRETGRQERQGPGQNGQGGREERKGVGQDRCEDRRGGRPAEQHAPGRLRLSSAGPVH